MDKRVWTYEVPLGDVSYRRMPASAEIVSAVARTGIGVKFWALLDPNEAPIERGFVVAVTGETLPTIPLRYIGTAWDGMFAGHLFEVVSDVPE